jgi:hypothetical protein
MQEAEARAMRGAKAVLPASGPITLEGCGGGSLISSEEGDSLAGSAPVRQ